MKSTSWKRTALALCAALAAATASAQVKIGVIASTIDVDAQGDLYLTAGSTVHALDPATGADRWATALPKQAE